MTMVRSTILFILITLLFGQVYSQSEDDLRKYWNYRDNLTSRFLVVGIEPGMSLPAAYRNDNISEIKWADNLITLGWYIGVLATEYHLLNDNSYPDFDQGDTSRTSQNKKELYCALFALTRLDLAAERSFRTALDMQNSDQNRNGFLIRDDVPENFYEKFPEMKRSLSDYNNANDFDKEMSQDQIYHVLLGLSLVKRFVPSTEQFNNFNFVSEAEKQARLITYYLSKNRWRIKNPLKFDETGKLKSVHRGHQAYIFSGGIVRAVNYIAGEKVKPVKNISLFYCWYWKTLKRSWNPTYYRQHNVHMVMAAASAGNGWNKRTPKTLIKISHRHEWYAYPLIHQSIFQPELNERWIKKRTEVDRNALLQIRAAPENGIRSPYPGISNNNWSNNMRYIRDLKTQKTGRMYSQDRSYNGLDFMLLFNAYYITHR